MTGLCVVNISFGSFCCTQEVIICTEIASNTLIVGNDINRRYDLTVSFPNRSLCFGSLRDPIPFFFSCLSDNELQVKVVAQADDSPSSTILLTSPCLRATDGGGIPKLSSVSSPAVEQADGEHDAKQACQQPVVDYRPGSHRLEEEDPRYTGKVHDLLLKENSFVEEEKTFSEFPMVKPERRIQILVKETVCIPPRTEALVRCSQPGMDDPSIFYICCIFFLIIVLKTSINL